MSRHHASNEQLRVLKRRQDDLDRRVREGILPVCLVADSVQAISEGRMLCVPKRKLVLTDKDRSLLGPIEMAGWVRMVRGLSVNGKRIVVRDERVVLEHYCSQAVLSRRTYTLALIDPARDMGAKDPVGRWWRYSELSSFVSSCGFGHCPIEVVPRLIAFLLYGKVKQTLVRLIVMHDPLILTDNGNVIPVALEFFWENRGGSRVDNKVEGALLCIDTIPLVHILTNSINLSGDFVYCC